MKNKVQFLVSQILASIVLFSVVAGESPKSQNVPDDFDKMTFEVLLGKKNYLPFEPILVTFKLSNQTDLTLTTSNPDFLHDSKIRVTHKNRSLEFDTLVPTTGRPFQIPGKFIPGSSTGREELLTTALGEFFPEPGAYQIQFVLYSPDKENTLESDPINITIESPAGADKEAYDFLKKHEKYASLFSWANEERNGVVLLENFVNKFSDTAYGEMAIYSLGMAYLRNGKLDKAGAEFEKIKLSQCVPIAADAKRMLSTIDQRQGQLKNAERPN